MSKAKVLIVDDDPDIRTLLCYNLEKEGYVVKAAKDGKEALDMTRAFHPDLIILDIMMPRMDGIEACYRLRDLYKKKKQQPRILFLTAREEEYHEVAGFSAGADDYILKPIKTRALLSRIRALLRRQETDEEMDDHVSPALVIGPLVINKDRFSVSYKDKALVLRKKEFEVLYFLATHPHKVYSRETLMKQIWGDDVIITPRTVDVHIRRIREKIGKHHIQTFKGLGYLFETPAA